MISVFVEDLRFETIIGLLDFERSAPQEIKIDASFEASEFIDYAHVCDYFKFEMQKQKFVKVEDAIEFFVNDFKRKYPTLKCLNLKISKTKIISNAIVGAKIQHFY